MGLLSLDHYSIRTADLETTRRFYVELFSLDEGERPPFPFPGHWLYVGTHPVVHLIGINPDDPEGLQDYLGDREAQSGTGALDHIAFKASGATSLRDTLRQRGIPYRERRVPSLGLYQLFVTDPNGIVIELNYDADETPADLL